MNFIRLAELSHTGCVQIALSTENGDTKAKQLYMHKNYIIGLTHWSVEDASVVLNMYFLRAS